MALVRAGAYGGVIDRREQVLAHKRKGKGGRTHLVSPKMAAAIKGRLVDITKMAIVRADAYGGVIDRREQVLAHKRKGKGGRTHLVSPKMAAAIKGRLVDITKMAIVRADAYGGVIDRREQVLAHKRKGKGGRTHLASPQMAAATAIEGRFVDIRKWHASI